MRSPLSLNQNIVYLAAEFAHRFHRVLTDAFRRYGLTLTVEQFSILAILWYKDGINQQEISAQLGRDKTTIARVINTMEKNKLVRRVTDTRDTRGKLITLTAKGKALQEKTVGISGALYRKCVSPLGNDQHQTAIAVLLKMMGNLQ
jgi:DNA-binding MarR family transcriptional regulator